MHIRPVLRGASKLSFVDPYFLGYRVALGLDLFAKEQKSTNYVSYTTQTIGGGARLGFALREDLGLQLRYSLYQQKITLPSQSDELQQHQSGLR